MSIGSFVRVPEFDKDSVTAAESAPQVADFVDLGGAEVRQRTGPYDGTWVGRVGRIPNLDAYGFDYVRFAFGGVVADDVTTAAVTVWELVPGATPVAVAVESVSLGAGGALPSVQVPRAYGAVYAVTVSALTGVGAELSFNVAVRGEYDVRLARVGLGA